MKNPNETHPPNAAQMNANRENAQKSTGPRTTAGKAASSRNGLKHGLCADKHLLPGEDPEDFLALVHDLLNTFHPVGEGEEKLVLRMAADQWRLDRIFPMEAGILRDRFYGVAHKDKYRQERYADDKEEAEEDGDPIPPPPAPADERDLAARAFIADCVGSNALAKLARYESAIERSIDRCLRQLKAFQAARNTPDPAANAPDPASEPSKTESYEANPNNGGDAQLCPTPPPPGPAATRPSQPAPAPVPCHPFEVLLASSPNPSTGNRLVPGPHTNISA